MKIDPLLLLGTAVLVAGLLLVVYGFIPQQQSNYQFLAAMHVPLNDSSGKFILSPENYFVQQYNGAGSVDKVICSIATGGWQCFGYQFSGSSTVFNSSSITYGLGLCALGAASIFAGRRWRSSSPSKSLARPIRIKIDEGICLANGVCVALAPNVFQFKKQDTPTIFAPMPEIIDPSGADYNTILQAAQMCPTGAIIIEDEATGERIHPPYPKR
ncbi:MAG: ferredoxin [Nitrososphaerales archaeon]